MTKKQKKMLWRIVITAVMLIALHFLPITGIAQLIAYLAAYAVIGYDILRKAGKGIANGQAVRRKLPYGALPRSARSSLPSGRRAAITSKASPLCCFTRSASCSRATPSARAAATSPRSWTSGPDYANIETDGKLEQVDPGRGRRRQRDRRAARRKGAARRRRRRGRVQRSTPAR